MKAHIHHATVGFARSLRGHQTQRFGEIGNLFLIRKEYIVPKSCPSHPGF